MSPAHLLPVSPVYTSIQGERVRRLAAGDVTARQEIMAKSARERLTEKIERMAQALKSRQEGGDSVQEPSGP